MLKLEHASSGEDIVLQNGCYECHLTHSLNLNFVSVSHSDCNTRMDFTVLYLEILQGGGGGIEVPRIKGGGGNYYVGGLPNFQRGRSKIVARMRGICPPAPHLMHPWFNSPAYRAKCGQSSKVSRESNDIHTITILQMLYKRTIYVQLTNT